MHNFESNDNRLPEISDKNKKPSSDCRQYSMTQALHHAWISHEKLGWRNLPIALVTSELFSNVTVPHPFERFFSSVLMSALITLPNITITKLMESIEKFENFYLPHSSLNLQSVKQFLLIQFFLHLKPLSANPTKWSKTHKQTIHRLLPTNCLSRFGHFVGLALKGLRVLPL